MPAPRQASPRSKQACPCSVQACPCSVQALHKWEACCPGSTGVPPTKPFSRAAGKLTKKGLQPLISGKAPQLQQLYITDQQPGWVVEDPQTRDGQPRSAARHSVVHCPTAVSLSYPLGTAGCTTLSRSCCGHARTCGCRWVPAGVGGSDQWVVVASCWHSTAAVLTIAVDPVDHSAAASSHVRRLATRTATARPGDPSWLHRAAATGMACTGACTGT